MRLGCLGLILHLLVHLAVAPAADILTIFPYRLPSLFQVVRPLVRALVERGHRVTMITPVGLPPDIEGVRHVRVPMLNQLMKDMTESDQFLDFFRGKWSEGILTATILANASHAILSDGGVQRMLHDRNERFDMILMEASHLDALYGLAKFYNATLMGVACVTTSWNIDFLAGNPAPSVYEPVSPLGYALDHSLISRWHNWVHISEEKLLERLVFRPAQLRVIKKVFGYSADMLDDLRSSFSVILINSHFSMGRVRSNVPNLIEVGGLHLSETPEPCSEQLKRFMDEAEHGVIYISMGLDILFKFLPHNVQQPLQQAISRLKQRVVWKSDIPSVSNSSDNIYVIAMAPQREVLAHPNLRLFISHGGLLSVMEAIHSGVPVLGLPLFFDQFNNLHRVEKAGMAKVLDPNNLNADTLTITIEELLGNPEYAARAKNISECFRDRPMSPLETAVWWTEYALRNRDVAHMRLNVEDIPLIRYYRLDSVLSVVLRLGFVAGTIIVLCYRLYQKHRDRQRRLQERERVFLQIRMPLDWYETAS
ncbi:hypothetical protein KR038_007601 [Drosophila bunnanda]|nr:hypothetical protein KR038_007601 [Drosophila bunnanda]